jgi:hypothetical protein
MSYDRWPAAERREIRKRGGLDYRDVSRRDGGFYVGRRRLRSAPMLFGPPIEIAEQLRRRGHAFLSGELCRALGVSSQARLHQCSCDQYFISGRASFLCLACRKGSALERLRAYTAERALRREAARNPTCERCQRPIASERSTKRFCCAACKKKAKRARRSAPGRSRGDT